jgi:hypothetical protein
MRFFLRAIFFSTVFLSISTISMAIPFSSSPAAPASSITPSCVTPAGFKSVSTQQELIDMRNDLMANYFLCNDIKMTQDYPVLQWDDEYAGIFEGNNKTIEDLRTVIDVNIPSLYIGLFSTITETGVVKNLTILNPEMEGRVYVGAVAGRSFGIIENVVVMNPNIRGTEKVAGIIGWTGRYLPEVSGIVKNCSVQGVGIIQGLPHTDTGGANARELGGIAGQNSNVIINSFVSAGITINGGLTLTGTVGGGTVGGLVGSLSGGTIEDSHSHASIESVLAGAGGLVGMSRSGGSNDEYVSIIRRSFATGSIAGGWIIGGIAGQNNGGSIITESYSTSDLIAETMVGGITGRQNIGAKIIDSYFSGTVQGESRVGGIVGFNAHSFFEPLNDPLIDNAYSYGLVLGVGGAPVDIGGVVGFDDTAAGTINNSYYNKTVNPGLSDDFINQGRTVVEMHDINTYLPVWDISMDDDALDTIWEISNTQTEPPVLGWQ